MLSEGSYVVYIESKEYTHNCTVRSILQAKSNTLEYLLSCKVQGFPPLPPPKKGNQCQFYSIFIEILLKAINGFQNLR